MFLKDPYSLGILFVALGLTFWLVSRLFLRAAPKVQKTIKSPDAEEAVPVAPVDGQVASHEDAVLVVQTGGRLASMNARARQIFNVYEDEFPGLERLAHRVRPGDVFLSLCSTEGKAKFALNGRLLDAISYKISGESDSLMMVVLRYPEITTGLSNEDSGISVQSLQTFTELAQAIASTLDVEATARAVLESVEKLLPADFMELSVSESEGQAVTTYRFVGFPGSERNLEVAADRYPSTEGYSGYIFTERKPLLVPNVSMRSDLRPSPDFNQVTMRSYLGIPLQIHNAPEANEFVGVLELGSINPDFFGEEDLELIRLLSGQAAVALRNAMMYRDEQRRSAELSGLAQLAQAFSSVRDSQSLFARLVQSIVPLVHVEILGFMLYNESQRRLEGQAPYYGVPSQFMELYHVPVLPNSPAEELLINQQPIISEDAIQDPLWFGLGWNVLARAANLHDTALVPLTSSGRMIGYLQASNHVNGITGFAQDELHLLTIIANQAAPIIENATLVTQTRQRAQRAEALRRITSLASSAANLDEIFLFSIKELAHLLRADMAAAFLIDPDRIHLRFHPSSVFGNVQPVLEPYQLLAVDDPQFPFTVAGSQHAINYNALAEGQPIIPYYQALFSNWSLESAVIVPLVVRDEGIGELWIGSRMPAFFDLGDLQVVVTAAGQLAGVVEQSYLVMQTDDGLRRRVDQLTTLSRISRELSASLDLNSLMQLVYDEAVRTTQTDYGMILVFDLDRPVELTPKIRLVIGDHPIQNLSPLELRAVETLETVYIHDFHASEYQPPRDGIDSVLIVPIIYQHHAAGLILLQAHDADHFNADMIDVTQSLASQAALALGNAVRHEQEIHRSDTFKRELETLARLIQVSHQQRPDQNIQEALRLIGEAITEATPFQVVLLSLYDPETGILRPMAGVGISLEAWEERAGSGQPWAEIDPLLSQPYQASCVYFVPAGQWPGAPEGIVAENGRILPVQTRPDSNAWDSQDLLLVLLRDANDKPLGLIRLDSPIDGRRPDRLTFEALDLFSTQASLLIENHLHVLALMTRTGELEASQSRLEEALETSQRQLPMLLHSNLEQTMNIQVLDRQIQHIRTGLEIAALAARQKDVPGALRTLAREMLSRYGFEIALIAVSGETDASLVDVLGNVPGSARPEALFGQDNPLRHVLSDPRPLIVSNTANEPDWKFNPLLNGLDAHSFIALPLTISAARSAGVLICGKWPIQAFNQEDYDVFIQLANQVSVSLQNLEFLIETRRRLQEVDLLLAFSRKLTGFDSAQITQTLIESLLQAIPAARAGWVAMWNANSETLVPAAARGYSDNASMLAVTYTRDTLPARVFLGGHPKPVDEVHFAQDYSLSSEDLMRYRQCTGGNLPVSSLMVPVSRGDLALGLVVLDNFNVPAAFINEDEAVAVSLAQQTALALENARLFTDARQRTARMQALARVSGRIASSLKSQELILTLLDQLKPVLDFETATLWLRQGDQLSVAAASGFGDDESRVGLTVALEDSRLFQEMDSTHQPISVTDVRSDDRFPSLLEPDLLSWLGIPLISKSALIGVVALEKKEIGFYSPEYIQMGQTFASQAAVALDNARLFEESQGRAAELDQRSRRLALLNRLSEVLGSSLDIDTVLKLTASQLLEALNSSIVSAVVITTNGNSRLQVELPETDIPLPLDLPANPLLDRLFETQGIYTTGDVSEVGDLASLQESYFGERDIHSLLVIPLMTGADLFGWLWVQHVEKSRFSLAEIELARTMCNQSAIAIQNARLFAETRRLTEDLEQRVEARTAELRREHQNTETLLNIITELSASLDLGQVLHRTLVVLNQSLHAEKSIILLPNSGKRYQAGSSHATGRLDSAAYEKEFTKSVMDQRAPILAGNLNADPRWKFDKAHPLPFESVLAVPLVMGEEVLGVLLLFHSEKNFFFTEQVGLVEATARQIGVALNNAELFNLIRDQAEHMGSLLREQQIAASRSRAILEAVADGVLVTDEQIRITLLNASAERILGLNSGQVLDHPLDQFTGLFGRAALTWMQTIRTWSENPAAFQGEAYAEQISLDGGRVVSVHLAPVIWRSQLLGTVSIFRDITHEIQVDRMKSEFVANVSHELRTPMTSIKGYVDIILMGAAGPVNNQVTHFLQIVKSNTERLSVLVNDLLDISRIEAGRVTLDLLPLNLKDIAEDVIADVRRRSREENKPMTFTVQFPPDLPKVCGDLDRVRQVLGSLVMNGYNYTHAGGHILIDMAAVDGEVQVNVRDDGIGIVPKDRNRIFERFYRGEDPLVLKTSGTGLGLALSKTLVEMQHGRIWFQSSGCPGEGSTFSFTLPIYEANPPS